MYYTIISVIAIMIHLILNHLYFRNKEEKTESNKAFKRYIWAALIYYITDAFWGVLYEIHNPGVTYVNTILYYLAMALTVVLLCRYVTAYLELNTSFGKFINIFGIVFGIWDVVILCINHFVPIFFSIDAEGVYHAYNMRYGVLYMQVLLCILLAIQTGHILRNAIGEMRKKYLTVFMFCVEMMMAIIAQIVFPLLPMYSIGLVLGIAIIHTFVEECEKEEQYKVLVSLADIFYSMHVIDLTNDTAVVFNAQNEVKALVDRMDAATDMMRKVIASVTKEEYAEDALDFTNLSTLADRMRNKKILTAQFEGRRIGWFIGMFVVIEADKEGKPTKVIFTTRIIEEEKRQEEKLIHTSQTDELTGLYNRRAYEDDIYAMENTPNEFVYVALDVNGLKIANDTVGHAAGDELLCGASECMRQAFGSYGRLYRTGGDEFVAIVSVSGAKMKKLVRDFDEIISNWKGKYIDELSISYGYVSKEEYPGFTMPQFATEADRRMYLAKTAYYQKKGIDRRGQQDAHRVLCETYTKILKINLTEDSYQIVNMFEDEKSIEKGFSDSISNWLQDFGNSGQVHPEDLEEYLTKTDVTYMKRFFGEGKKSLLIFYRRKYNDKYRRVMMEMVPANDYSDKNLSLFLYVKDIE